jgi:hypothetical protein
LLSEAGLFPYKSQAYAAVASAYTIAGQMTQWFHVFGTGGQLLWVNPWVGQPPALWHSERAQLTVTRIMTQGAHHGPEPEPAPAPDLPDGLSAGELLAGDRHMQVTVIGPVTGDVTEHQAASSDWEPSDSPEGCPFRDRLRHLAVAGQCHRSPAAWRQGPIEAGWIGS